METAPTFGIMHDFRQPLPWQVSPAEYYAECLGLIEDAEQLGYECVWMSEHHGTPDGFMPSPLVIAAAIAARTERIKVGTNVLLLPLHHPMRVAEEAAVVDTVSNGRLLLGVGQGYAPDEFALFEIDRRHRPSRFEESLLAIRQAWRDGHTGFTGKRFDLPDLPFALRCAVPIYVGATGGPALDRAVRLADGLLCYVAETKHVHGRYADYRTSTREHGRDTATFPFLLTSVCHVATDADVAWQQAAPGIAYLESPLRDEPVSPDELPRDDYLVGTPEQVAERLVALHADTPFDHFAFWARLPGLTVDQAAASQRLFATEVAPALGR